MDLATEELRKALKSGIDEVLGRVTHYASNLSDLSKNLDVWK